MKRHPASLLPRTILPGSGIRSLRGVLAVLFVLLSPCAAQEKLIESGIADTSSPRATLRSFQKDCDAVYHLIREDRKRGFRDNEREKARLTGRILSCLDLSEIPQFLRIERGEQAAVCLKEVLDRIPIPPSHEIPGFDDLPKEDEPPLKAWRLPRSKISIKLMESGIRKGDYLFSAEAVATAPLNFEQVRHLPYKPGATKGFYQWFLSAPGEMLVGVVQKLPEPLRTTFWGRQAIWQWLGLAIVLVVGLALMVSIYTFGRKRAQIRRERGSIGYILTLAFPIAAILVPLVISTFVRTQLRFSGDVLAGITFSAAFFFLLGMVLVIIAAGGRVGEVLVSSPRINTKGLDAQMIRIMCRLAALVTAIIVFLQGGQFLGIPLSTLLASAGVGGFAFALAAQDSLKNFFGSVMIILDKPFKVGERIQVGGFDGMVEEIGLRSTRLRLLTGHQAIVPNEEMARSKIENIGRRPHIRRLAELRLPLDTPTAKAQRAVEIVREILADHEGLKPDFPPRVFLADILPDALTIKMIYWYHPPDYWAFLAASQGINLAIKQAFEAENLHFALPTTSTRLVSDHHPSITPEDRLPASRSDPAGPSEP